MKLLRTIRKGLAKKFAIFRAFSNFCHKSTVG
jgi:hypothetical protein